MTERPRADRATADRKRAVADESPLARLMRQPRRFGFDAAVRLLQHAARHQDPAEVLRFRSAPGLAQPPADVLSITPGAPGTPPQITVSVMGLVGATGVLPRGYSEVLSTTLRNRSRALHDFLDLLSHGMVGRFAQAGAKYRLHRAADLAALPPGPVRDPVTAALLALTGYAAGGMADRLQAGTEPLCHYAGYFAMRPRSADRLQALVSDWCGRPVQVLQFTGAWLALPPEQRTALPHGRLTGQFCQLGIDAAVGVRAWDAQAGVVLQIGPLNRAAFEALLPGSPALIRLVSLVRAFLGFETGFAINPVLAADAVPALQVGAMARLGWNTWLPTHATRVRDGHEAVFEADAVEATGACLF